MSKKNTYQDTPLGELQPLLAEQRQRLAELQVELRLQKTNAHSRVRALKREIARILTALRARQSAAKEKEAPNA